MDPPETLPGQTLTILVTGLGILPKKEGENSTTANILTMVQLRIGGQTVPAVQTEIEEGASGPGTIQMIAAGVASNRLVLY